MRADSAEQVIQLSRSWCDGNPAALGKLTLLVNGHMRGERDRHTLQTIAVELDWNVAQAWLLRELIPAAGRVNAKSE